MTTLYNIEPNFVWAFLDNNGLPASGGKIYTWEAEDHDTPKAVYQDEAGMTPWPNPITLDASGKQDYNGTFYPIFWADDAPYFVQVADSDGNIIAEMDFFPSNNSNQPVITEVDIENYIINGGLFNDYGENFQIGGQTVHGFQNLPTNNVPLSIAPDNWYFLKDGAGATDYLLISDFIPGSGNVTANPKAYFNYVCNAPSGSEVNKQIFYQFNSVRQFQNQTINLQFVGSASFPTAINIVLNQNFGVGGSATVVTNVTTINLTTTPTNYQVTINVPSINGKIIGNNNDDSLWLIWQFPNNAVCNIFISEFFVRYGSTFVNPQEESVNITYAQSVANQIPLIGYANLPIFNSADGNFDLKLLQNGTGFSAIPCAGKIYSRPTVTSVDSSLELICNGPSYYSNQYYNLANKMLYLDGSSQFHLSWGVGANGFLVSYAADVVTATNSSNGAVSAGSAGNSAITFVQTDLGSGGTPGIATITAVAGSALTESTYFLINGAGTSYYAWFSLNNQSTDPGPATPALSGKQGIKIIYQTAMTADEVAIAISAQLACAQFLTPTTQGLFLRGWADGSSNDPDRASRIAIPGVIGGATGDLPGTYQAFALEDHTHTYNGRDASGAQFSGSPGLFDNNIETSGANGANVSTETRPSNVSVVYVITY